MTDLRQDESARKQTKKRAQKQSETFDPKDVAEGKKLAATLKAKDATLKSTQAAIDSAEMKLGKLADGLRSIYGDKTLERFAKDIGIAAARLKRCRSVYRAWKGKGAPGAPFAVLQELEAHPQRDEILRSERPPKNRREARTIMRDYRRAHEDELDWRIKESRRWFAGVVKRAQDAISDGHPAKQHVDPAVLRQALDDRETTLSSLRLGGQAWISLADIVERALADDV